MGVSVYQQRRVEVKGEGEGLGLGLGRWGLEGRGFEWGGFEEGGGGESQGIMVWRNVRQAWWASGGREVKSGAGREMEMEMEVLEAGVGLWAWELLLLSSRCWAAASSSSSPSPPPSSGTSGCLTSTKFLYPNPCLATFRTPSAVGGMMNIPVDMFSRIGISFNRSACADESCMYARAWPVASTRPRRSMSEFVHAPVARMVRSARRGGCERRWTPATFAFAGLLVLLLMLLWAGGSVSEAEVGGEKINRVTCPVFQLKLPRRVPIDIVRALTSWMAPSASTQPLPQFT